MLHCTRRYRRAYPGGLEDLGSKAGRHLPNLAVVAEDLSVVWKPVWPPSGTAGESAPVEVTLEAAIWYHTGLPVPLRWVLARDPQGAFAPQALLCPDLRADLERILSWFALRCTLEATFEEVGGIRG
jgi:hypothetical protein